MPIYRADCPMASIFFLLLLTSFASLGLSQNLSSADSQENVLAKNESNNTRSPLRRSGCGPPVWTAEAFVTTVVYTTIFCVSVMGNCLVIVTIINNRQMRTVTNMFLLNLAISDLILTVFCIPTTLIGPILFKCFLFGPVMCKVFYYVQPVSVTACAHTLVVIAMERYFAICKPLQSRRWQTRSHSIKMIVAVWVIALVFNFHYLVIAQLHTIDKGVKNCRVHYPTPESNLAAIIFMDFNLFIMPLGIMTVLYGIVIKTLWTGMQLEKMGNDRQSLNGEEPLAPDVVHPSSNCRSADGLLQPDGAGMFRRLSDTIMHQRRLLEESKRKRSTAAATRPLGRGTALRSTHTERNLIAKKRVIKMLAAIVIEFLVCWMPFYIFRTLLEFNMVNTVSQPVYSSLLILAFVSSCTNPITYCFMNKKFRQAFLLIFGCRQCAKPSGDSTMLCRIADKRRLPSVVAGGDGFPRINVITNRSGLDQSVNQALLTTDYSAGNLENSSYSAIDMPIRKQAVVVSDSPLNMATLL